MKKLRSILLFTIGFASIFFTSCGGGGRNNTDSEIIHNDPVADSIAFHHFCRDYNKVSECIKNEDFEESRRLLGEIETKYDFSTPTNRNVDFLILLSHTYYWNAVSDRIRNDDDLIERSLILARKAYKMNREYAKSIVNGEELKDDYDYRLLIKNKIE